MKKNLIYAPLAIMLLFIFLAEVIMERQLTSLLTETSKQQQITTLNSLHDHLLHSAELDAQDLQEEIKHLAEPFGYRITVIQQNGQVLADSNLTLEQIKSLDNHSNRPEVLQSKHNEVGVSWRYSNTLGKDMLFTARSLNMVSQQLTLRISRHLDTLHATIKSQENILFGIGGIASLFILIACYLVTRRVNTLTQKDQLILEQRVSERTEAIHELNRTGTLLSACNNFTELNNVARHSCLHLLPDASGAIAIYHTSKNKLELTSSWGELSDHLHGMYLPEECWGLRKGTAYLCKAAAPDIRCPHTESMKIKAAGLCLPLIAQGDTIGMLHLYSDTTEYLRSHRLIAQTLAENLSLAVANLQLRQKLHRQATRDPLTGLFNRRYLMESFNKELDRSKRKQLSLAVFMLDVDHFKKYNDDYGHGAGDTALSVLGDTLNNGMRSEDIVCRYGGEEFTIILVDSDTEYAQKVAERTCREIRELEITQADRKLPRITISIGIAMYPQHGARADDLLKVADNALYQAKADGRDRAKMAENLSPPN